MLEVHSLAQDEQQPERPQGGRISRDTLLLIGALTFFIIAVALTFVFTPGSGPGEMLDSTPSAEVATSPGTAQPHSSVVAPTLQITADASYPAPAPIFSPSPTTITAPVSSTVATTTTLVGLPVPTGDVSLEPTLTRTQLAGGITPTPMTTQLAGGITPTLTIRPPAGGTQPTLPAIGPPTKVPYPGPVGDGTPPTQPTLNLTVVTPTRVPLPVATPTIVPPPPVLPTVIRTVPTPLPLLSPSPTVDLALDPTATAEATEPTPTEGPPPPPPVEVLRGNVRWTTGQSPITLHRDVQIIPGAELTIEPGVEVRLDPGVAIYVDGGRLLAMGLPGQPVRLVGATGARWGGLFGRPGSFVVLEQTVLQGGGASGTVLAVDEGTLIVRGSRFNDNGGAIVLTNTKVELRDSEIAGNDMPFGPAFEASYSRGNAVTMSGNRFGGNRLGDGTPQVRLSNSSTFETLSLTVEGNLIRGGGPNLQLSTNGPLTGSILCNNLVGDGMGFGLRSQTLQTRANGMPLMALRIEHNRIDEHLPPLIPVYLRYGLGRGATSEILLDMRNNWWGEATGPYEPDTNPLGRGDSVGNNIIFASWLTAPPACAPVQ